ncbi:MAG: saccharopine dehydrogenase NADP-binding domain-containing protein [Ignavibacteriales bacterium]|nr:saccharopine dehydrogenase NADP-binding domain-containing protein [Ignavibacteriales bacterium]
MKFLVIGSGLMGSALAFDLARSKGVQSVTLADQNLDVVKKAAEKIGSDLVRPVAVDVNYFDDVVALMEGHDCAIGAVSYRYNHALSKAAIEVGSHYCDLGGNDEVVQRQLTLDAQAKQRNVAIVPNCGLAPGLANVLAARGAEQFDAVESIFVRVGGLPQHPKPPLNYQLAFSVEGLINEYSGKSVVIRDGRVTEVDTMTEVETIEFPPPFGKLEAFHTSGGTSLLPAMFEGKVRELNYKTIRYAGHCEKFKALLDLGFASSEPVTLGSNIFTEKEVFFELLKRKLPFTGPDVVLLRAAITGTKQNRKRVLTYNLIDFQDESGNITAMMRTTSFPTSVIAQLLASNRIQQKGVLTPEQCVPLEPFLTELRQRNIDIEEEWK